MGASEWSYYVPYKEDLSEALAELRQKVFTEHDYFWDQWRPEAERRPWPKTLAELYADEGVRYDGTHSILDIDRIVSADEVDYRFYSTRGAVQPVDADEAYEHLGVRMLTRDHVPRFDDFPRWRWFGRCAVLHDEEGRPTEIYFWGHSGD